MLLGTGSVESIYIISFLLMFVVVVYASTNDFHELRVKEGGREAIECGLTPHNESHGGSPLRILVSST